MVLSKRTRSPLLGCIPNGRWVFLARRKSVGLGELSSSFGLGELSSSFGLGELSSSFGLGELGVNDTKLFFYFFRGM